MMKLPSYSFLDMDDVVGTFLYMADQCRNKMKNEKTAKGRLILSTTADTWERAAGFLQNGSIGKMKCKRTEPGGIPASKE